MEELEKQVMAAILAGNDPRLPALRLQYAVAQVTERKFSEVGFFTYFRVAPDVPSAKPDSFELGHSIHLEIEGVENGAGVVLFIRNGVLDMLKGFTYTATWPRSPVLRNLIIVPERQKS